MRITCGILAVLVGLGLCLLACDRAPSLFLFLVGLGHIVVGLGLVQDQVQDGRVV